VLSGREQFFVYRLVNVSSNFGSTNSGPPAFSMFVGVLSVVFDYVDINADGEMRLVPGLAWLEFGLVLTHFEV
jgi:hypothetical protein